MEDDLSVLGYWLGPIWPRVDLSNSRNALDGPASGGVITYPPSATININHFQSKTNEKGEVQWHT